MQKKTKKIFENENKILMLSLTTRTIPLSVPLLREALWEAGETIPPLHISLQKVTAECIDVYFEKCAYPLT